MLAVPFDLSTLAVTGAAVPVLEDVRRDPVAHFTLSTDGWLAYVAGPDMGIGSPVWVDRNGVEEPIQLAPRRYGNFAVSPDGSRLAISVLETSRDIWLHDFGRGTAARRWTVEGNSVSPLWTSDGRRITFFSDRGEGGIFSRAIDAGIAEPLLEGVPLAMPFSWSSDGLLAYVTVSAETSSQDIWLMSADGSELQPFVQTPAAEWSPSFSPNGQWVAYTSDESGQYEIYVGRNPPTSERWQVSTDYGEESLWSPKGGEIFYRRGSQWLSVAVKTEPEFEYEPPQVLFEGSYVNVNGLSFAVSPDAQRFIVIKSPDQPPVTRIHLVAIVGIPFTQVPTTGCGGVSSSDHGYP